MTELTLAPLSNFDVGAVGSAAIAVVAYRARSLDGGGAVAAFAVGTATYGALGPPGAAVLLGFFVTSVAFSRMGKMRKEKAFADIGKTGPRDAAQVFANGGVAAICALLAFWVDARYAVAFAGAFAAATADTWGTEIGSLARLQPRSILTRKPIATGLSGGVTAVGLLAEFAAALLIALVAHVLRPHAPRLGARRIAAIVALVSELQASDRTRAPHLRRQHVAPPRPLLVRQRRGKLHLNPRRRGHRVRARALTARFGGGRAVTPTESPDE